jgi:hypothetical protein
MRLSAYGAVNVLQIYALALPNVAKPGTNHTINHKAHKGYPKMASLFVRFEFVRCSVLGDSAQIVG